MDPKLYDTALKSAQRMVFFLFFVQGSFTCYSQEINDSIFNVIKTRALETNSDALIIKQNGRILHEDYYGEKEVPIYIASAGKSLTGLAIGKLIDDQLLDSLDQPVHSIYPQWKQGNKKDITVRMLLNHTSGIQNHPNASLELEPPPDYKVDNIIDIALAAELSNLPGEKVDYNNKAVALLGGIVQELSGLSFDNYFAKSFFEPLNIHNYDWIKDRAGNPTTHGAFVIKPSDLIKFGELILNKGSYEGKRVISENWIRASLTQSQNFTPIWGLLWWRLPEFEKRIINNEIWEAWTEGGVPEDFLEKMKPMQGVLYESKKEFYTDLEVNWNQILGNALKRGLKSSKRIYGKKITAFYASGHRGNTLVVVPEHHIIAVRCADHIGFNYDTDFFHEFVHLISKLAE